MTFAVPIALALAAISLPIIAFYILKLRLRRVPVSTNLFWKQIFDEKPPRSLWQNFRHLLSLLLQLLMLLLLVLSIADPYFPWQLLQARRIVIVIDNSASMRATDVAPSRFDVACKAARNVIEGLRFRDEVALILAGQHPEVIVGMTNHAPTLRRAIDSLSVSDIPTLLESAIELGQQLIGEHPHGQVIVFTDGCVDAVKMELEKDSKKLVYQVFGSDASNVGITQFQVRRSLIDPIGYEALASVKNASAKPVKCRLELTLDDVPVDVLPLDLKPGETWCRSIEKTSLNGGRLMAALTQIREGSRPEASQNSEMRPNLKTSLSSSLPRSEAPELKGDATSVQNLNMLVTDDVAWAVLPSRQIQKVLIVSKGNLFLRKVFEANPLVKVEWIKDLPSEWPDETIVVLHRQVPSQLPSGNLLVIDPEGACDLWDVGPILENAMVTQQDKASSLMTHIRLDNVVMPQVKQLQWKVVSHSLAETVNGDSIYAELKRDNGKCLVLSVNLEQSDLAFRTAFPIMVTNSLGWFAGQSGELRESLATGSMASVAMGADQVSRVEELTVQSPKGIRTRFHEMGNATGKIGPLDEAGIWSVIRQREVKSDSVAASSDPLFEVAVNLANSRETDLQPSKALQDSAKNQASIAGWLGRPVWFYLIFIACAVTTIEWFLYQRRLIA